MHTTSEGLKAKVVSQTVSASTVNPRQTKSIYFRSFHVGMIGDIFIGHIYVKTFFLTLK